MSERSDKGNILIVLIVVALAIVGAMYYYHHSNMGEAIDETVDVFVPDAAEFERRMSSVDQARSVVGEINSRPTFQRDRTE